MAGAMVAVAKRQLVEPARPRVMVLGADAAGVALAVAGIGVAGGVATARDISSWEAVPDALRRGEADRVLVLDAALASRIGAALGGTSALARRVVARSSGASEGGEPSLDELVRAVVDRSPSPGGETVALAEPAEPVEPVEIALRGVSAASLLGAAAVLRPTLELAFHGGGLTAGIHLSDGLIRAAGVSTAPPRDDPRIAADPSLRLVTRRWPPRADAEPGPRLAQELAFIAEYGELFTASGPYRSYVVATLRAVLDRRWEGVEVRAAHAHARGIDLIAALREAFLDPPPACVADLVPDTARVVAPGGLPARLRDAFPPPRYGRLFFLLEGPRPVRELAAMARLDPAEVRAALAVGLLTGAVELVGEHTRPLDHAPLLGARRERATTLTGATGRALAQTGDGDGRRFIERLADAAARGRREGTRVRVHKTRFEPVGEITDDLVLGYRIGHGGMGDVLLGVHCSDANVQKVVAVKRRTEEALRDPARLEMFFEEARLSAVLTHPNIVQTFQLLRVGARYGLVMELVHGVTAEELIALTVGRPLPPALVAWIGAEVAAGLDYAHRLTGPDGVALGLVHRDVAPPNLMLGVDGGVKLIDFGVANVTVPAGGLNVRSGRAAYMAPEVLAFNAIGPATDQFALAVTLYKLLTGALPFEADAARGIVEAILNGQHVPVLEARPDVPPALAYVVERGLARSPGERFASCDAMRHALLGAVPRGDDERGLVAEVVQQAAAAFLPWEIEAIARMRRAASGIFGARPARRLAPEAGFDDREGEP